MLRSLSLLGFASWLRVQHREELEHALKFYEYIHAQNGRVTLAALDQRLQDGAGGDVVADAKGPLTGFQHRAVHRKRRAREEQHSQKGGQKGGDRTKHARNLEQFRL